MNDDKQDQIEEQELPLEGDFSLGAGVDIVTPESLDDIEIESYNDDAIGTEEVTPQERIKKLREKLKECSAEKQSYLDGWQRLKADFVNYKRREEEGKQDFLKYSREGIVSDLIPVLESFRMAFANKEAWEKVDPAWRNGVEYIHTQLMQVLSGHGLSEVNPIGEIFNPSEHNAIETVQTRDAAQLNKIAEVLHVGYRLNGKLLKSPQVKVYGEQGNSEV